MLYQIINEVEVFTKSSGSLSQVAGFHRSKKNVFFSAPNYELPQSKQLSAWMQNGYGNPGKSHFSWVYIFSVMHRSLKNWTNHDRYRLRSSTTTQLLLSSKRLKPLS